METTKKDDFIAKIKDEIGAFSIHEQDEIINKLRECLINSRIEQVDIEAKKRKELEVSIDNLKKGIE